MAGPLIPAIVLAAGKSSRMGRPKALLPLDPTDTFLTRVVRTLRTGAVDDVVVVVGHEALAIVRGFEASGLRARFVDNPDYERGQLTSLVAGLNVIDRPGVSAALVALVDVPAFAPETVRAIVDRYVSTHAPVVRPTRAGVHGHPILIDRRLFDALRRADPSGGAKPVIRDHASATGDIELIDPGAFTDIDTPSEYEEFVRARGLPADLRLGEGGGERR
jgi:molybdenum cofactor cytidylyltransferase